MDYAPLADSVKVIQPIDISLEIPPTYSKKEQLMEQSMVKPMEQPMDIDEEKFHKENKSTDFITVCCTIEGQN